MTSVDVLKKSLDDPATPVAVGQATMIALESFGVKGQATLLSGERDHNFKITEATGAEWVLKVAHPAEDAMQTDLHAAVLDHLAEHGQKLITPRTLAPIVGTERSVLWDQPTPKGPRSRRVRMYTYLPGRSLSQVDPSPSLRRTMGRTLAKVDLALVPMRHPGESHDLIWNLSAFADLAPLVETISLLEPSVASVLPHLHSHMVPAFGTLRQQMLHNDFNPHNLLTDGRQITGVIDFGDVVRAPLIQDLAVAAAYQVAKNDHPLAGPAEVIAGFHQTLPLFGEEIDLLRDLMLARHLSILAISTWRAEHEPHNREYLTRTNSQAWMGLRRLGEVTCLEASSYLREVLHE